jgi:hypothetical protein
MLPRLGDVDRRPGSRRVVIEAVAVNGGSVGKAVILHLGRSRLQIMEPFPHPGSDRGLWEFAKKCTTFFLHIFHAAAGALAICELLLDRTQ